MTMENTYYADHVACQIRYTPGERELTSVLTGQVYHNFNGFMLLTVI